jgi:hypothetical protein
MPARRPKSPEEFFEETFQPGGDAPAETEAALSVLLGKNEDSCLQDFLVGPEKH